MEILKSLFRSIVRLVAINIALILFFASAPLLYVTVPFWVILTHKSVADMATIYMLSGPFVRSRPIALAIPPQSGEGVRESGWRLGRGEGLAKIV
jgi:hypothetical protein